MAFIGSRSEEADVHCESCGKIHTIDSGSSSIYICTQCDIEEQKALGIYKDSQSMFNHQVLSLDAINIDKRIVLGVL